MTSLPELKRLAEGKEPGQQNEESLTALVNDVGLIVNPSLRISASVASECLKYRKAIPTLIGALEKAVEALEKVSHRCATAGFPMVRTDFLLFVPETIAEIKKLVGET